MEAYADENYYLTDYNGGDINADDGLSKRLRDASRDVDALTFNRIRAVGVDNLTEFQKDTIKYVVCRQADFVFANRDMIESVMQSYSLNGVSVSFGAGMNVVNESGIIMMRRDYEQLKQTGLCCRLAR